MPWTPPKIPCPLRTPLRRTPRASARLFRRRRRRQVEEHGTRRETQLSSPAPRSPPRRVDCLGGGGRGSRLSVVRGVGCVTLCVPRRVCVLGLFLDSLRNVLRTQRNTSEGEITQWFLYVPWRLPAPHALPTSRTVRGGHCDACAAAVPRAVPAEAHPPTDVAVPAAGNKKTRKATEGKKLFSRLCLLGLACVW